MRPIVRLAGAALFVTALTAFVTWPQIGRLSSHLVEHQDSYFSIWRTSWIAHALITSPLDLFNANIFYPARGTLAYSDAVLLEGLLAAPLHWSHVSPVLIYNLALLAGFVGSGIGMFVLARYVTGATGPALVSAAAFTLAPYRIEHIMHLELQWAMWVPLTWWALHRAVADSSWRYGVLAGVFFGLQALSCVYYSVFLALTLVVFVPLILVYAGRNATGAIKPLALAFVVATVVAGPYVWMYASAGQAVGLRGINEVTKYSAQPISYLATSASNIVWGWTADRWGDSELRLSPGLIVYVLALISITGRSRKWVLLYGLTALLAFELSLGVNGIGYHWLLEHLSPLRGLRAMARFGMLTSCALAMLAGLGAQALIERGGRLSQHQGAAMGAILALMLIDCANRPLPLGSGDIIKPSDVYKVVRSGGPGVVLELPVPHMNELPGFEAFYSVWSVSHWHPLVNGYSGYFPPDYAQTLVRMEAFPSDAAMARLRAHNVRYIIVHNAFMAPEKFTALMLRMATQKEFRPWGTFRDPVGTSTLFVMEP